MVLLLFNIFLIILYWAVIRSIEPFNFNRQNVAFLRISFIHILLLYMFKDNSLFTDLDAYSIYYRSLKPNLNNIIIERSDDRFEIGWYILNKTIKFFNGGHVILFLLSYLFILYSFFRFIKLFSAYIWISVVLFMCSCFYDSMFVLRQWIAISICLWSIPYIIKNNFLIFFIVTSLAISFHYSAIIWLFSFFLYKIGNKKRDYVLFILIIIVIYSILNIAIDYIRSLFPALDAYTTGEKPELLGMKSKPLYIYFSILLFCYYCFGGINKLEGYNRLFFLMVVCSFIMSIVASIDDSFTLFTRLSLYYGDAIVFLIPNAINRIHNMSIRIVSIWTIFIFYFFLLNSKAIYGFRFFF